MLRTEKISVKLGQFSLNNISIDIAEGEYYVLLGRSGAGKSQLLELLCGLTSPDEGKIYLNGRDITNSKIQDRNLGLVFQDFSLFPHMSVRNNISYSLRVRKIPFDEIDRQVASIASEMNISDLLDRKPGFLSGGEKQRVALARTLIIAPDVLLLDEPLSSVDASLKDSIRRLLRRLNRNGQTIIHVTHDFSEAISLASRVGVIHNGRIIQEGTPDEVFRHPANKFVARYAGIKNFFRVKYINNNGKYTGVTDKGVRINLADSNYPSEGLLIIRSGEIILSGDQSDKQMVTSIKGIIDDIVPTTTGFEVSINAGDYIFADISGKEMESGSYKVGEVIWASFDSDSVMTLSDK
jgi:ABC-type sugar transport system ATPase subunit